MEIILWAQNRQKDLFLEATDDDDDNDIKSESL
jgi:hypothetical protein